MTKKKADHEETHADAPEIDPAKLVQLTTALRGRSEPEAQALLTELEGEPGTPHPAKALGGRFGDLWERFGPLLIDLLIKILTQPRSPAAMPPGT